MQAWKTPSKWILAGEHTVLRGGEALVFPLFERHVKWNLDVNSALETKKPFQVHFKGLTNHEIEIVFWSALERACVLTGLSRDQLFGTLVVDSNVPLGMGLGASATLSVGLIKVLRVFKKLIQKIEMRDEDVFLTAQKMENFFHGESSGLDVAVVFHQQPLSYRRGEPVQFLKAVQLPSLRLSHCGRRGMTKECVEQVQKLHVNEPLFAKQIDMKMSESVTQFKKLMGDRNPNDIAAWTSTMELAHSCFEDWKLVPLEAKNHIESLKQMGAVACKMTGSGGGGFILSLWNQEASVNQNMDLIPITLSGENK